MSNLRKGLTPDRLDTGGRPVPVAVTELLGEVVQVVAFGGLTLAGDVENPYGGRTVGYSSVVVCRRAPVQVTRGVGSAGLRVRPRLFVGLAAALAATWRSSAGVSQTKIHQELRSDVRAI